MDIKEAEKSIVWNEHSQERKVRMESRKSSGLVGKSSGSSDVRRFRIPSSFMLFGETIKVVFKKDLIDREDIVGAACYRQNRIELQDIKQEAYNRPESQMEVTFLHELVHFILWSLGEDEFRKDEKLVNLISRALHQVLTTMKYD